LENANEKVVRTSKTCCEGSRGSVFGCLRHGFMSVLRPWYLPLDSGLNPEAGLPADTWSSNYNLVEQASRQIRWCRCPTEFIPFLLYPFIAQTSCLARFRLQPIFWTASINQSIAHCFTSLETMKESIPRQWSFYSKLMFKHITTKIQGRSLRVTLLWKGYSPNVVAGAIALWAKDHRTSIEMTDTVFTDWQRQERLKRLEKCIRCSMTYAWTHLFSSVWPQNNHLVFV